MALNPETKLEFEAIVRDLKDNGNGSLLKGCIRLFYTMSHQVILLYRIRRLMILMKLASASTLVRYFQNLLGGNDISGKAQIGRNFRLPHPFGIVIGDDCVLGNGVVVFQQVTIGTHGKYGTDRAYPILEDRVRIFTGAKIIGGMRLGKDSVVGANAVVLKDVPAECLAVGVPAKYSPRKDLKTEANETTQPVALK